MNNDIMEFILCHFILEIHKLLCHYKFNFMSYINITCPSKQLT